MRGVFLFGGTWLVKRRTAWTLKVIPRSFPSEWISFLQSIAAALDKHLTSFNESRHHPISR